ncbi:MAG: serine hydroxymethyltransferase [Puniceicoccales bacterium]|jgi:glycine hydroxymethyltransferase|nr:serine hydroxymethyltransferase [Puniceicoccales bacterium]
MESIKSFDPELFCAMKGELARQRTHIELIASENFASQRVLAAAGSVLTNKYAEGYPGKRYYGGCGFVDQIEQLAIDRAKKLFGAEHANVQPHSGSQANMAVYAAALRPGDKIMALSLGHGGHLTHGYAKNFSGMLYRVIPYETDMATGYIDYNAMSTLAQRERPKLIVTGASALPRVIDFEKIAQIATGCGALLCADIAHIAGLVAAGLHPAPFPWCDFVTSTTHKTLRGPRGGLILCKEKYAKTVDASVFPQNQGGPLMHIIAAKAICFLEALQPEFHQYQKHVVANAKILAEELQSLNFVLVGRGTDNHLMLIDLRKNLPHMAGKEAQSILEQVCITTNRNVIPGETRSPFQTSGLRLGTPAVTTRGMDGQCMRQIAKWIHKLLTSYKDETIVTEIAEDVQALCGRYPLPYINV